MTVKEDKLTYKEQLARKEQECDELKSEIACLRSEGKKSCAYCADYIAKEQECELLKDENKILENNLDSRTREFEEELDFLRKYEKIMQYIKLQTRRFI